MCDIVDAVQELFSLLTKHILSFARDYLKRISSEK